MEKVEPVGVGKENIIHKLLFKFLYISGIGLAFATPRAAFRFIKLLSVDYYTLDSFSMWLKGYYSKISRNYKTTGRYGYTFDEVFGNENASYFESSWLTYFLYGKLSSKCYSSVSIFLFLVSIIVSGVIVSQAALSLTLSTLIAFSPLVLFSFFSGRHKPEVLWWSAFVPVLVLAFNNQWFAVWCILSLLFFANITVSVSVFCFAIGIFIWNYGKCPSILDCSVLILVPGLLKLAYRLFYSYKHRFLATLAKEQRDILNKKKSYLLSRSECVSVFFELVAPLFLASWNRLDVFGVCAALGILYFYGNSRIGKIADSVTLKIVYFCLLIASAFLSGLWYSTLVPILYSFYNAFLIYKMIAKKSEIKEYIEVLAENDSIKKIKYLDFLTKKYPWFEPVEASVFEPLHEIFANISNNSRVLMESHGRTRSVNVTENFVFFRNYSNSFLPQRGIEFINQTYLLSMNQPELAKKYLDNFNFDTIQKVDIMPILKELGIKYVIAYSMEFVEMLMNKGFVLLKQIQYKDFADAAEYLRMPNADLYLLQTNDVCGIIEPHCNYQIKKNKIIIEAIKNVEYKIKYNYTTKHIAKQNGRILDIEGYKPVEEMSTSFMKIKSNGNEEIHIEYRKQYF